MTWPRGSRKSYSVRLQRARRAISSRKPGRSGSGISAAKRLDSSLSSPRQFRYYSKLKLVALYRRLLSNLAGSNEGSDLGVKYPAAFERAVPPPSLDNISEAVSSSLVNPFGLGLFGLNLKTMKEKVRGADGKRLSVEELLVRVLYGQSIKESKVNSMVRDDTNNGNSNSSVSKEEIPLLVMAFSVQWSTLTLVLLNLFIDMHY